MSRSSISLSEMADISFWICPFRLPMNFQDSSKSLVDLSCLSLTGLSVIPSLLISKASLPSSYFFQFPVSLFFCTKLLDWKASCKLAGPLLLEFKITKVRAGEGHIAFTNVRMSTAWGQVLPWIIPVQIWKNFVFFNYLNLASWKKKCCSHISLCISFLFPVHKWFLP